MNRIILVDIPDAPHVYSIKADGAIYVNLRYVSSRNTINEVVV